MATNVQRGGLGFEKFFRRRSSSPERTNDAEGNDDEDADPSKETNVTGVSKFGKFFGQKSGEDKNESNNDPKSKSPKEIDEVSSQKTDGSKKSSKKKKPATSKKEEKNDDSEVCKELIIKDEVGQVKLADIINNSIKEAVLNIVKEGVCPLGDSLERTKDPGKKTPSSVGQEPQDKENKPGSPENLASLLSGANKTFDSHLCRSQYQPSTSSRNPQKASDQERVNLNQFTRELCPFIGKDRKSGSPKPKIKGARETSPKISRLPKGSSHYRTDNRRMTGNVNIYICSEANENAKDKKQKGKNQCNDDSETTSETKTSASSLSISTSKLVAALRKRQRKNQDDQPLSCLCDIPESLAKQYPRASKSEEGSDDVSCLCDDGSGDAGFLDSQSSSSRDCICDDEKFSDMDLEVGSDLGNVRACTSQDCAALSESVSDEYASYDNNDFWPCTTEDCPSYQDDYGTKRLNTGKSNTGRDVEERCSCCNLKRCKKVRSSTSSCHQEPRSRNGKRQSDRCPCIVEEEEDDCCVNKDKEAKETFTVCRNVDPKEKSLSNNELKNESEKNPSESGSGILKGKRSSGSPKSGRSLKIASTSSQKITGKKDDSNTEEVEVAPPKPESPKTGLFSTFKRNRKKSADRESKTISEEISAAKNSATEPVTENGEASKDGEENVAAAGDAKQKNSFFYRSIKKAMNMVSTRKDEDAAAAEENGRSRTNSPESPPKPKLKVENEANGAETESTSQRNSKTEKAKPTVSGNSSPKNRSKSRISTAIASRRSSAATSNNSSNVSIPEGQTKAQNSCSPTNLITSSNDKKSKESEKTSKDCKCQKPPDSCDCCCKMPEPPIVESCKCNVKSRQIPSDSNVCCKKIETPKTKTCCCCPICGNPADCCICCKQKPQTITEDPCKCCPRCQRPIAQCKCCCTQKEEVQEEFCECCCKPKRLCCCERNSRAVKSQPKKCRQPSDFKDNNRRCGICCYPKAECRCNQRCGDREERCPKSMICIYCDNPQENCICRAPVRKCSQCGLPLDVCNCKPAECCDCSGRVIAPTGGSNEQTICVTAWKPRRSVRRYFARGADDENFEEDCPCYDKTKPYGSDGLPYQKRGVFSTVMSELQQKMSGSVCCNVCRKVPCCCCCSINERGPEEKSERRQRPSSIAERRIPCPSLERSRSKSPAGSCKCTPNSQRKRGKKSASKICDRCRTSPCRCRRSSTSPQKTPQAKCYYCKNSPCVCVPAIEPSTARQFRNADSSHSRKKERGSLDKKINAGNENNGYRGRAVVPRSGSQQIRKYCYRENPTKEHALYSTERVR